MLDIDNYKRAVAWLLGGLLALQAEPDNEGSRLRVLHSFEVVHNVSEGTLREAYATLGVDEQAPYISTRELLRRAREKGIAFSTPKRWLEYSLMLESAKQSWYQTASVDLEAILCILPAFADELEAFANSLEIRMASLA